MKGKVGVLAFGSLIDDLGELSEVVEERRGGLRTPFRVEFARTSQSRGGAPTLVPVSEGGAYVEAVLFVLRDEVALDEAKDKLYRREIHSTDKTKRYEPSTKNQNQVWIEVLQEWAGLTHVLYTRIAANLEDRTAKTLATLAVESAKSKARDLKKDGIQYLIRAIAAGIQTPLSQSYAEEILRMTNAESLHAAWDSLGVDAEAGGGGW